MRVLVGGNAVRKLVCVLASTHITASNKCLFDCLCAV